MEIRLDPIFKDFTRDQRQPSERDDRMKGKKLQSRVADEDASQSEAAEAQESREDHYSPHDEAKES